MNQNTLPESPRLRFREMSARDFPDLCLMLQDPRVVYAWEHCFTREEVWEWICRNQERYRRCGLGYWLAEEKESGKVVGQIGLMQTRIGNKTFLETGYMLKAEFHGKGYATEGVRACLDYAFRIWEAPFVLAEIRPENTASIRVAERLGMRPAGMMRKVFRGRVIPHRIYLLRSPFIPEGENPDFPRMEEGEE